MKVGIGSPAIPSSLRLGLTLIIVLMVISSPIVMLVNPPLIAASFSTEESTSSAPSTIGQDGSDFTTQAALSSLTARPTNNIVNTNSFYDVVFLTATAGTIKTIQVTFPAGTTIPSGAFFNEAEGIGPGTVSKSGQTITYTVTNAVNVPAGTKIRLEFANFNNPLQVSASYTVTVTTRDASNSIIDGPSQSTAYTIKQIGVNAIANNAVTSPKLAEGSVTLTKPAESFMKRVTALDNAAGNAVGWNPNGVATDFTISSDGASFGFLTSVLVSINLDDGNNVCGVDDYTVGGFGLVTAFRIKCTTAPPNGADLHYVVENLPPHLIS